MVYSLYSNLFGNWGLLQILVRRASELLKCWCVELGPFPTEVRPEKNDKLICSYICDSKLFAFDSYHCDLKWNNTEDIKQFIGGLAKILGHTFLTWGYLWQRKMQSCWKDFVRVAPGNCNKPQNLGNKAEKNLNKLREKSTCFPFGQYA